MPRFVDLETGAHPDLGLWLDESDVKAPANLKDPAKIEAAKAEKLATRISEAALKPNLNRIVVWGESDDHGNDNFRFLANEDEERSCLLDFWTSWRNTEDAIVGFNISTFDMPTIIMRSWLLGVTPAITEVNPYRPGRIVDLRTLLGQGDKYAPGSLTWWCKRFGITVEDDTAGKDVAAMLAAGDHAAIVAHCRADIDKAKALYARLFGPTSDDTF